MDELKSRAAPKHQELIDGLQEQKEQNETIILLLTSLNRYHGNPENEKGWLEDLYLVTKCEKKATKKHRSTGFRFAILVTIAALVGESLSKGESSIFITILKFAKGLVL